MFSEIIIIENCLDDELKLTIANTVNDSQKYREESWNNYTGVYGLSHLDSVKIAVEDYNLQDFWIPVIVQWNRSYWNDIQGWAEKIKEIS